MMLSKVGELLKVPHPGSAEQEELGSPKDPGSPASPTSPRPAPDAVKLPHNNQHAIRARQHNPEPHSPTLRELQASPVEDWTDKLGHPGVPCWELPHGHAHPLHHYQRGTGPAPGTQPQAAGTEGQQVTAQGSGSESDLQRSDTLEAEQPFHMLDLQVAALGGVESTAEESKAEELEGPVS